jgi:ABC-2 type transport system ATP-binding protein
MIEGQDLSKNYGRTRALRSVGFQIEENEIVGLLGPNGAGKTTLMKILTGYLQPSTGTARIGQIDVIENPLAAQALIGYLPENAPIYGDMLVQDYLTLIAELREVPRADQERLIADSIVATDLGKYLVQPVATLSKGLRQRVGLAQAILHKPKVLILDEPTSGLDPNQIVEIRQLIRKLARSATVLLSTHILSEVEVTCERVLIIIDGELRTDAKITDLSKEGGALVAVNDDAAGVKDALQALPGVRSVMGAAHGGFSSSSQANTTEGFQPYRVNSDDPDLCPAIYNLAVQKGWRLAELRPERQTLETVFRSLTHS